MEMTPIGIVHSPYKQKFAVPRQPNLVPQAEGEIHFAAGFADPNCLRGIEQFSHLWLIFHFHETAAEGWSPLVQPPRLGGREKIGVFASRATFRPNALGMSVVENRGWRQQGALLVLTVGGIDLVDGTPVLDIKPYVPYADSVPGARSGYADTAPGCDLGIDFSAEAQQQLDVLNEDYPGLREFICGVLAQDPRPAWRRRDPDEKRYGMSLYDLNIKWRVGNETITVLRIEKTAGAGPGESA